MTKSSEIILNTINMSNDHLSAEDILLLLRNKNIKISLATIYNNLQFLVSSNLIRKISIGDGPDLYDRIRRHDHLICAKCGKITDVELEDLKEFFEKNIGVTLLSYDLKLNYLCNDCKENKN